MKLVKDRYIKWNRSNSPLKTLCKCILFLFTPRILAHGSFLNQTKKLCFIKCQPFDLFTN
jgi:hypothetical protein